ncbi:MAG TPA: hypothetical protein PKI55_16695, partial [Chitinophagaceae bacterium]|nr:hypothetical protein [Chitinophagaceae bacterium]
YMKQHYFLLTLLLILAVACRQEKKKSKRILDGGPCTYRQVSYPAKLIKLVPVNGEEFDAFFELKPGVRSSDKNDTVSHYALTNKYVSAKKIKAYKIEEGKVYRYNDSYIVSGMCNPHVMTIRFEIYK